MTTTLTPVYAPATLFFMYLTTECPLRCHYCFVTKEPRRMSIDTAHKAVDCLFSRHISGAERRLSMTFFGGEPFLETDTMTEIIRYARQYRPNMYKEVRFSATTSGVLATPAVEKVVRDGAMDLLLSLDGTAHTNRARVMASGQPSYRTVVRHLERFKTWASSLVVRATFHPEALDLVGNVRHLLELGAPSIALCPVLEASWADAEDALNAAYDDLADWYIAEAQSGRHVPLEVTREFLRLWYHHDRSQAPRPSAPCGMGKWLLAVDPEGRILPCHRFLYRPQDALGTVDSPLLSSQRWDYVHVSASDILGCDTCPAEPICGGGCRLVALQGGVGLRGAHPGHCITMRAHLRAIRRIYTALRDSPILSHILNAPWSIHPALSELRGF